jgi:antitoxin component of MazEF toxin-antitoxin module
MEKENVFCLEALVNAITPDNLHSPIDFGVPVGKEFF